ERISGRRGLRSSAPRSQLFMAPTILPAGLRAPAWRARRRWPAKDSDTPSANAAHGHTAQPISVEAARQLEARGPAGRRNPRGGRRPLRPVAPGPAPPRARARPRQPRVGSPPAGADGALPGAALAILAAVTFSSVSLFHGHEAGLAGALAVPLLICVIVLAGPHLLRLGRRSRFERVRDTATLLARLLHLARSGLAVFTRPRHGL